MDSCEERISNDSVDSSSTDVDITFLPLIYEIIRRYWHYNDECTFASTTLLLKMLDLRKFVIFLNFSLERDPHDPAQKNAQSQDISLKVLEIQKKLDEARDQVSFSVSSD